MITRRPAAERGHTALSWLDSRHAFSFGDYVDPRHVGHGALRVLNEDVIAPGAGFTRHRHANMEILTVVLEGAVEHEDDAGHGAHLAAGDAQCLGAGSGMTHRLFNASHDAPARLLQAWLQPAHVNLPPTYARRHAEAYPRADVLTLLAASAPEGDALPLRLDARVWMAAPGAGTTLALPCTRPRGWLQVASGGARLGDMALAAGDGARTQGEASLLAVADEPSLWLWFELP